MKKLAMLSAGCLSLVAATVTSPVIGAPLYPNSVVSNDHEFIATSDQSAFACLVFEGRREAEMPDKRTDSLMARKTFIFTARYTDGTSVGLWAHTKFKTEAKALKSVAPAAEAIGKLPTFMRKTLDHVVIHRGDETAFGEGEGHFFVLYSENIKTRIRNHDLEETVFHESVHATLDSRYAGSKKWLKAQKADGDYITKYAKRLPKKEDMAESALFAWTMIMHPGRLPAGVEQRAREIMPNRIAFFEELFLAGPVFEESGREPAC
ncbi:MAG: hypothetical protein VW175_10920 [Alphaproteobacteria bacterium]